ncbi:hypothetical protein Acy02nite_38840 [Actinoplanes cyaneus]|uniref:SnoaL-like domain-containing protein n=1 Tax=Actinoplanes cyaneus TaxID=52696 RepID=A0A919IIB4_9ACTN|nr:nuclear transport factor 2 family protein [Actinoplanes cyaneus]MCW2139472.1 SnoaL-like domain-containing protein [Actinoplanes cyaneus]GID66003.1 hypothetical protein Acy02nite_38840 [Actinoplanes cyaneus]
MNTDIWHAYAAAWTAPAAERRTLLERHVSPEVAYRDPGIEVRGRDELAGYMHDFGQAMPGLRFAIVAVDAHHDRSLAHWEMRDPDDVAVQNGISHAAHDAEQRLTDITGFFPMPAA